MRRFITTLPLLLAAAVSALPGGASAQAYPNKPIRLVMPFAAGGIGDILGRLTADHLGRAMNGRLILENRPGAGCNIGTDVVAKAAPDGYVLGLLNVGCVAINPWLYKDMPFDALNDLVAIATIGEVSHVFGVNSQLPVATVREFIAFARQVPGKLNYGSAGAGTPPHLSADFFSRVAGIDMVHVPYKGAAPIALDLSAGRIQVAFLALGSMRAQIASGQVRALAVARKTRLAALPNVPTFEESGVSGFEPGSWWGLMGPRGIPPAVVATLSRYVSAMLDDPEARRRLQESGTEPLKETPEEFTARVRADHEKWREVVRAAGLKPE